MKKVTYPIQGECKNFVYCYKTLRRIVEILIQ